MGILETLVTPLVKDLMETYFSNFDSEKLEVGTGNFDLSDMLIRPSVLDDYGVPLKLVFGKVGKLSIQFSLATLATDFWSKSRDVELDLRDVYVLLAPPTSVRYTENDEAKKAKKRKQLEAAIESDPDLNVETTVQTSTNPSMIIGIINNLKVNIENIHIRYEDETTNKAGRFACGLTLKKLSAVSTDEKWTPTPTDKTAETFYKLLSLESLGIYWNTDTTSLRPTTLTPESLTGSIVKMNQLIHDDNHELKYILGNLSGDIKAIVTMKPNKLAQKFSKPLADVTLNLKTIELDITNGQFHDVMLLLQSLEDASRKQPYLAFRPFEVPYKGNAKKWWKYAYNCYRIGVQKRSRLYDTNYLVEQKRLIDEYEVAYADYRQKLTLKTATDEEKQKYLDLEDRIGNQDILIIRKRVALKDSSVVANQKEEGWTRWTMTKVALDPESLKKVLQEKLTPEELSEVEEYINLDPEDPDARNFPEGYTQMKFEFKISMVTLKIQEALSNGNEMDVFQLYTKDFCTKAKTYPAENGMWLELTIGQMGVNGLKSNTEIPSLLRSVSADVTKADCFFFLSYETNPLNAEPGKHIKLSTERLEVFYDGPTLQKLIDCFTWPEGVELQKTTGALMSNAKNMSQAGMKELIENTEQMFLDVSVNAPYILLPSGGIMSKAESYLILNAGKVVLKTNPRESTVTDAETLSEVGNMEDDVNEDILKLTYNQYVLTVADIEIIAALQGEDYMAAINHTLPPDPVPDTYREDRPVTIFKTENILINVNQSIIKNDTRFPQIKADVLIPNLDFQLSDYRALKLVSLILSTPIPARKPAPSSFIEEVEDDDDDDDYEAQANVLIKAQALTLLEPEADVFDPENAVQYTNLLLDITVKRGRVYMLGYNKEDGTTTPRLDWKILDITFRVKMQSFGVSLDLILGETAAAYLNAKVAGKPEGTPVYLIKTPETMTKPLIKFHSFTISDACPRGPVGEIQQKVFFDAHCVDIMFHQESLEGIIRILDQILEEFFKSDYGTQKNAPSIEATTTPKKPAKLSKKIKALGVRSIPKAKDLFVKATAFVDDIALSLTSEKHQIAKFHVGEIILDYEDRPLTTRIFAQIRDIEMTNLDTPTNYTEVMKSDPAVPFAVGTVITHKEDKNTTDPNMSIQLNLNCPPIICIGEYLGNIMDFVTELRLASTVATVKVGRDQKPEPEPAPVAEADLNDQQTDTKLLLDINLVSPKLIIVKGSLSSEAILVDLGNLILKNKLEAVDSGVGPCAVVDKMEVTLNGISISRVIMDYETQNVKAVLHLLAPSLLNATLQRNLSPWYIGIPSIELEGALLATDIKISVLDVEVAATCIMNYLKRVEESIEAAKKIATGGEDEKKDETALGSTTLPLVPASDIQELGFKFEIQQIGFYLYNAPTLLDGKSGEIYRDEAGSLSQFFLQQMNLDFKKWKNLDIDVALTLEDMVLRDSRPTTGAIKDFIIKKEDPGATSSTPFLQLGFSTRNSKGKSTSYIVNLFTEGLSMIIYLEYAQEVLDFALAAVNAIPKDDNTGPTIEDGSSVKLDKIQKKDEGKKPKSDTENRLPLIQANVKLSRAELMFLEDLSSEETNALTAYGDASFKMESNEMDGSWGEGTLTCGIKTARYTPNDEENEHICDVLEPIVMTLKAILSPKDGILIDILFSTIFLHVNAGTVLLVRKMVESLSSVYKSYSDSQKAAQSGSEVGRRDYADIWTSRKNDEQDYWFLNKEGLEATVARHKQPDVAPLLSMVQSDKLPQQISINFPRALILIEAGVSKNPTPMLLAEGTLSADVQNWSSSLKVNGSLGACIYYNNIIKGAWEYLVETCEINDSDTIGEPKRKLWDFEFSVSQTPPVAGTSTMVIKVTSDDILEITLSKTGIQLLKALASNFGNSIKFGLSEDDVKTPPYIFVNDLSTNAWVGLDENTSGLRFTANTIINEGWTLVKPGESLELGMQLKDTAARANEQKERTFTLNVPEFENFQKEIYVGHTSSSYFQVGDGQGRKFGMLVEIKAQPNFSTVLLARSVVELRSELSNAVEVTAYLGRTTNYLGTIEPYKTLNVPIYLLMDGVAGVVFEYKIPGYKASTTTQVLAALAYRTDKVKDFVVVKAETEGKPDGKIQVIGNAETTPATSRGASFGKNYRILLKAPLVVNNFCPVSLEVSSDGRMFESIPPGHSMDVLEAKTQSSQGVICFKIKNFRNTTWVGHLKLAWITAGQISSVKLKSETGPQILFFRYLPVVSENKVQGIHFFCPYWMVNRTGLELTYQGSQSHGLTSLITQSSTERGPLMMAYDVDGKEKAKFRVSKSGWSPPLNLDVAMTADFVCEGEDRDYEVLVSVSLSSSNLTKTVSFFPKYTISNTCSFDVIVSQLGKPDTEFTVPAKKTVPFWPKSRAGEPVDVLFKVSQTEEYTPSFRFEGMSISLLKLKNAYGGLFVNSNVLGAKGNLTISEFILAEVPVLLVNDTTDLDIEFRQSENTKPEHIGPRHSAVYAWDDLSQSQEIYWTVPGLNGEMGFPKKFEMNKPVSDEFTKVDTDGNAKTYTWATFISGARTIFIVTENSALISLIQEYLDLSVSKDSSGQEEEKENVMSNILKQDIVVDLEGIGISIVDDQACREVLYLRLESTLPMWEGSTSGNKFKNLPENQVIALEKGYVDFLTGKNRDRPATVEGGIKIDYTNFFMSAPKSMNLRRHAYNAGVSIKLRMYEFSRELSVMLAKLQIDNQLKGTEYRHLFKLVPIEKSVTNDTEILPPWLIFTYRDWSRGSEDKTINSTVILQEMKVEADTAFLKCISAVILPESSENLSKESTLIYEQDYKKASLSDVEFYEQETEKISSEISTAIYQILQAYKLKLIITASMAEDPDQSYLQNRLLALGSSTISVSDVHIEIDGLQILQKRWTQQQLLDAIIEHYKSGILANIYKFVLGLDILGNPTKLVGGLGTGLTKLVTEPVQGAMSGNLVEGISNGLGAGLEGTIFGVTDALGSVTKQLGKLTGGLGIPGVPSLLGALSGGLFGIGNTVMGDKNVDESLRPRRTLLPMRPLQPYSHYGTIGDTVYQQASTEYYSCGNYITHFLSTRDDGDWEILLLATKRVYCAQGSPKLDSLQRMWTYAWNEVAKIEQHGNSIKFKEPATRILFGFLPGAEQTAYMHTKEMADMAYAKSLQAWKDGKN